MNPIYSRNVGDYRVDCKCDMALQWVRLVCRNGLIQVQRQCPKCGDSTSAIPTALAPVGWPNLPLRDEGLRERTRAERSAAAAEERILRDQKWWARYHAYMGSPQWRIRSKAAIRRANGVCEQCEKAPATEAHHLHYRTFESEGPEDLTALCHPCHEEITRASRALNGRA